MKKILIGGAATVCLVFAAFKILVNDSPQPSNDRVVTAPTPNTIDKNSESPTTNSAQALNDRQVDEGESAASSSSVSMTDAIKEALERVRSIVGFENAVWLSQEEHEEHEQWRSERGLNYEEVKNSDYMSYDKSTLYTLAAEQGDLKAYEAIRTKYTDESPEDGIRFQQLGMLIGAPYAPRGMTRYVTDRMEEAYTNGNHEQYRNGFVETLALYDLSARRGAFIPKEGVERFLSSYKLDDDIETLQQQAQQRSVEIRQAINDLRREKGWKPLDDELPTAIQKLQAAQK